MFDHIVGQDRIKKALEININAIKLENKAMPHSLFVGPAGLGKTTIAKAMAEELNVECEITNGANLKTVKQIIPFLMRLTDNSILFIDEIHSCSTNVFNYLLTALTDFQTTVGDVNFKLPNFTLIGATTNAGLLIKPLFDRFIFKYNLDPYSDADLEEIIRNTVKKYNMGLSDEALAQLVKISRGVPRIALNRLQFIKNYLLTKGSGSITIEDVGYCLELEGVSEEGYTMEDRVYLEVLRKLQPAGLMTIAATAEISEDEITNIIEPFLLKLGLVKKTSKGRVLVI